MTNTSDPAAAIRRILVFSDLQLDRPYTWAPEEVASGLRSSAREVLVGLLSEARSRGADVIVSAGNLFDRHTVRPSSIRWLATAFRSAAVPVLIAPGGEDHIGPIGGYYRDDWPDNVVIFDCDEFNAYELEGGIALWGAGHTEAHRRKGFFGRVEVPSDGINIAVFAGTESSALHRDSSLEPTATFEEDDITGAGFDHALVGGCTQLHFGSVHTYPGAAISHSFATATAGGGVLVTVDQTGVVQRDPITVPSTPLSEITVDVTGAQTPGDVIASARSALHDAGGVVRLHLTGRVGPHAQCTDAHLAGLGRAGLSLLAVSETTIDIDLESLADEQTVRGEYARELLTAEISEERRSRIAHIGLRALSGGDQESRS